VCAVYTGLSVLINHAQRDNQDTRQMKVSISTLKIQIIHGCTIIATYAMISTDSFTDSGFY